jgi:3D (Asp-Asp-Asp) domain-containing protein
MMDSIDSDDSTTPAPGPLAALGAALRAGVRFVVELLARIVNGLGQIGPVALAIGCQAGAADRPVETASVEQTVKRPDEPIEVHDPGPRALGKFNITFYYVIGEEEIVAKPMIPVARAAAPALAPANDNEAEAEHAAIAPPDDVTLFAGGSCDPIARVSRDFVQQLKLQGTGKLRDGRVLNVWGACNCEFSPCFKVTGQQWGTAGSGRPLQPFRTVAVDPKLVKLGSLLYIPLLEGRIMPGRAPWGGFVHDGCVIADDTGGGIKDHQIDLFVGKRGWFLGLSGSGGSHSWARHVPVFDGSKLCERKGRKIARKSGAI